MQQGQTVTSTRASNTGPAQAAREFLRHWLKGRRGLIIGGSTVVIAGLALGWGWLSAIGLTPLILSLAPCAAMCAIGACAMMRGSGSCAKTGAVDSAQAQGAPPTRTPSNEQES